MDFTTAKTYMQVTNRKATRRVATLRLLEEYNEYVVHFGCGHQMKITGTMMHRVDGHDVCLICRDKIMNRDGVHWTEIVRALNETETEAPEPTKVADPTLE